VFASALLLIGAVVGAGTVWLHWLPCRGSMLSGSVLNGYAYGPDFSRECLRAMDSGFGLVDSAAAGLWSVETLLGTIAVLLLTSAWTSVVVGSGWSASTKQWALLPALASVATLVLNVDGVAETLGILAMVLLIAPNVLAVVAFAAVRSRATPGAVVMWQVALALGASTAAGLIPAIADYAFMASFSDANWDAPPGAGYPTVVGVALIALALLVITFARVPARPAQDRAMTPAGI
jgi:hypothetical protein